jgi:hypothetical protein
MFNNVQTLNPNPPKTQYLNIFENAIDLCSI